MSSNPIFSERPMRIICIGAGAAGLCFAYKLQRSFKNFELVIYERNSGISGTWFENTYPGCACDFPAHNYTYSFEPSYQFSGVYAGSSQVREYFENFAKKYSLRDFVQLEHSVEKVTWQEAAGSWDVSVRDIRTGSLVHDKCHILINAAGVLNAYQLPQIAGIESYKGQLFHTARWPKEIDLSTKRVGVIGNGSTGQQVLPAIQPISKEIVHFIRQAAWTFGPMGEPPREWTAEELAEFQNDPESVLARRKAFETFVNSSWSLLMKDGESQAMYRGMIEGVMREKIKDNPTLGQLIPKFGLACQRPAAGFGYLEAIQAKNVTVVFGDIQGFTAKGIKDFSGHEHELDVVVCATGFDTSYVPRFSVIQSDGQDLRDVWSEEVKSYMATAVAKCPNYFTVGGPMNPFGSGAFLAFAEAQVDYILKFCNRWQTENIRSMVPKGKSVDSFMKHARKVLEATVWTDGCRSWYKGHTNLANKLLAWPGSGLHFMEALADPRYEDYEFSYENDDEFAFLGNGFSSIESTEGADRAPYLRLIDDSSPLGRAKMQIWKVQQKGIPAS